MWSWLSYMSPHRFTWGFAYSMPFAQLVGIVLLVSIFLNRDKLRRPPSDPILVVWIFFIIWLAITTLFALDQESAVTQLSKVIKIQVPTLLTLLVVRTRADLDKLVWVIVLSIGFFSVKGGLFTIMTGGTAGRVYGPPGSFIQENNSLALATLIVIPLFLYLGRTAKNQYVRFGVIISAVLSVFSVLGSQSRGALIGIAAVGLYYWWQSKSKLVSGFFVVLLAVVGFAFMPQSWHDRMETIASYEQDASAMGRINAWWYSFNVASDRLTGGGMQSWSPENFAIWAPNPEDVHAAHSIYFGILGDHGWPGLILFLSIFYMAWRRLHRTLKLSRGKPELEADYWLASMLAVSFVAYAAGGAFLSLSYFDLPWHLVAVAVLLYSFAAERKMEIGSTDLTHSRQRLQSKQGLV